MNKVILISVAALFANIVPATAAEQTNGIVETVNFADGTLTLQSGESFTFPNKTQLYSLLPGQRVGVTHEGDTGIGAFNPHPARQRDIDID